MGPNFFALSISTLYSGSAAFALISFWILPFERLK